MAAGAANARGTVANVIARFGLAAEAFVVAVRAPVSELQSAAKEGRKTNVLCVPGRTVELIGQGILAQAVIVVLAWLRQRT